VHAQLAVHPGIGASFVEYTIVVRNESSEALHFDPEQTAAYASAVGSSTPDLPLENRYWYDPMMKAGSEYWNDPEIVSVPPGEAVQLLGGFRPPEHNSRQAHIEFSLEHKERGKVYGYRFHF